MRLESGAARQQWDSGLNQIRSSLAFWTERLPTFLAVAALIEFLSLRLFIRLGPVLPRAEITVTLTETLITIGSVALTFALLLALSTLILTARQSSRASLKYCVIAVIVLTVGHALAGDAPPPLLYVAFILFALMTMGVALWFVRRLSFYTGWLALFVAAYLALAYPTLVNTLHLTLPFTAEARSLSELLIILATLTAPMVPLRTRGPRRDWTAVVVGVIGAVVLAGLWFSVSWLPPTLMIWSVALTGYLPAPIYILAFGLWLYTFTSLIKYNDARRRALGLALIALGGLRWDVSYYALLALIGFLLLSVGKTDGHQRPA